MTTDTATEQKAPVFTSDLQAMQFKMLDEMIVQRNGLVGKANAAHGDRASLTENIRENDTDPAIVEAREQMSKWSLKLDELVKPKVDEVINNAAGSVEEIETEIQGIDKVLKAGLNFYKKAFEDDTVDAFTKQERLQGTAVRSGGGGRRIRGFNVIITVDGETQEFENFTSAAKHVGIDTKDLQEAFFAKAGTDVQADLPDSVKLTVNFDETDSEGKTETKEAFVHVYRKESSADSSVPAVDEDESDESADDVDEFEDA